MPATTAGNRPLVRRVAMALAIGGLLVLTAALPARSALDLDASGGNALAAQFRDAAADITTFPPCMCPICTGIREAGDTAAPVPSHATPGAAIV